MTVGGAIAADVHGKNHHVAGSFARHVRSLDIALPGGELRTVTEQSDPELFWATAGGMGLTGLVVRAAVQLKRVGTSRVKVDTVRTADIDETMAVLTEHDRAFGYTVAWSDSLARGARLGRSVVTSGDFAEPGDLPAADRADPFAFRPGARLGVPPGFPPGLINRYTVALANEAWYRKAPRSRQGELQTIGTFFHPLDGIRNWNRVYGPGGFRQYQYVLPFGQEAAVRRSFELVSRGRAASFVTVLKRFGAGDPGLLSFPMPGWTLALDVPARTRGLAGLLGSLDRLVIEAGGRVYLAKDSRVPAGRWPKCTRGWRSSGSCAPSSTRRRARLGPVPAAQPVRLGLTASQADWLRVRSYLQEHRHALALDAAGGYPDDRRMAGTPLLAAPGWQLAGPVRCRTSGWNSPRWPGPRPDLSAAAAPLLPERPDGTRYLRYSDVLRELAAPAVFENRPTYRLTEADLTRSRLAFTRGRYFDGVDTGEAAAHEYAATRLGARSSHRPAACAP